MSDAPLGSDGSGVSGVSGIGADPSPAAAVAPRGGSASAPTQRQVQHTQQSQQSQPTRPGHPVAESSATAGVRPAPIGHPSGMAQTQPVRTPMPAPPRPAPVGQARGPRRARLTVKRVDPWSVLKFTFVFSIAILIIWIVAVGVLYGVLGSMGVFDKINSVLADFTTKNGVAQWQIGVGSSQVIGWAAVIGGVNAVLFTALATLGAFMYNLCSSLAGGIDVTLTERD